MLFFVTGATGFIGSHFLQMALAAGHHVRALRRTPASRPSIPLTLQPVWCDGDLTAFPESCLEGVDVVIHLASAGVSPKQATWDDAVQANVAGSLRIMQAASRQGVRRLVVSGTCHEYGSAARRFDAIPPNSPLEPVNAYGASKAAAFQLLRVFAIEHGLEFFYGRVFTAYGEGQYAGNFWPSLQRAALAGEDFQMTAGNQISDFIHVSAVAHHLLVACSRSDLSSAMPLVVNIGSGTPSTLLHFAQEEWKRLAARGSLRSGVISPRPNQIERYVPDLQGLHPTMPSFCC